MICWVITNYCTHIAIGGRKLLNTAHGKAYADITHHTIMLDSGPINRPETAAPTSGRVIEMLILAKFLSDAAHVHLQAVHQPPCTLETETTSNPGASFRSTLLLLLSPHFYLSLPPKSYVKPEGQFQFFTLASQHDKNGLLNGMGPLPRCCINTSVQSFFVALVSLGRKAPWL